MAELPTGDAEETEAANAALARPMLRNVTVFVLVLAIITVIAAIAMPILRDQRIQVNEWAAFGHICKIRGAQTGHERIQR